jgi:hypothetical protein
MERSYGIQLRLGALPGQAPEGNHRPALGAPDELLVMDDSRSNFLLIKGTPRASWAAL